MIVDRINIPWEQTLVDAAYSLRPQAPVEKSVRLRLLEKVNTQKLHLSVLRQYGLRSSMQSNLRVSGNLLDYIESFFSSFNSF